MSRSLYVVHLGNSKFATSLVRRQEADVDDVFRVLR